MAVTVEALNPRAKTLYEKVKQFITDKIAPVEQEYVRHSKSADRWKVFEPVEKLKVSGHLSRIKRKPVFGFPTRSDTNRAVQLQKMARRLKFRIEEEEGLYCPCS